jgi:hypothetical protein
MIGRYAAKDKGTTLRESVYRFALAVLPLSRLPPRYARSRRRAGG